MNKQDVIEFFDRLAPQWDADMIRHDDVIKTILDGARIGTGTHVLDVACGTGVLMPDYLRRNVGAVTGVDISAEMVKIAAAKFPQENVRFLNLDVEDLPEEQRYDAIMIYNAFPHFPEPARLIGRLAGLLKPGGTLTVAHGASRAQIDSHHRGHAGKVSLGLLHEDDLAALLEKHLTVTVKLSTDTMYQVTARRP